jgi:Putative peptidoglycan binding domain
MTATLTFYDAEVPPADPPETDGVAFYIGGDAAHVWSKEEVSAQKARYRLPVFVRSNPVAENAAADVREAVQELDALSAPSGVLVAWDVETAADPEYISTVYSGLKAAGYELVVYGSQSSVDDNENPDGLYWGAQWTGQEHLASGDQMTQYVSFTAYDESVALSDLPFWDAKPDEKPPVPAPAPAAAPVTLSALAARLPTITPSATGQVVRTIQALCCARGHSTAIDGVFGPQTTLAVEGVQQAHHISADGIVGPETWPVLLGAGE